MNAADYYATPPIITYSGSCSQCTNATELARTEFQFANFRVISPLQAYSRIGIYRPTCIQNYPSTNLSGFDAANQVATLTCVTNERAVTDAG